jgi:hypothetical protein
MTDKKKRFGGIAFSLFELRANSFDGYGFTLFQVRWDWLKIVCMSTSYSLLFINLVKRYEYGGEEWQLRGGILFAWYGKLLTKIIKPRKSVCENCAEYCENTDHFAGSRAYCSSMCKSDGEF